MCWQRPTKKIMLLLPTCQPRTLLLLLRFKLSRPPFVLFVQKMQETTIEVEVDVADMEDEAEMIDVDEVVVASIT